MSIFSAIHKFFSSSDPISQADAFVSKVLALMGDAEKLFPTSGSGASKLEYVRSELAAAWQEFDGLATSFEAAWPQIASTIAELVSIYKLFK